MTSFFGQKGKRQSSTANEGFLLSKTKKKKKAGQRKSMKRGKMDRRPALNLVDDDPFIQEGIKKLRQMKNASDAIKKAFDVLFISKKEFRIEIDAFRIKTFILSYCIYADSKINLSLNYTKTN